MALITTTPAGINPNEGGPNWQRLASRLIKSGNGIGLDSDGALLNTASGNTYVADEVWLHLSGLTFSHIGPSTVSASSQYFNAVTIGSTSATEGKMDFGAVYLKHDAKGHFVATASGSTTSVRIRGDTWLNMTANNSGTMTLSHVGPGSYNTGFFDIPGLYGPAVSDPNGYPSFTAVVVNFKFDDKGHSIGSRSAPSSAIALNGLINPPSDTSSTYVLTSLWSATMSESIQFWATQASVVSGGQTISSEGTLGTLTWTGTAPTSLIEKKYRWTQLGKLVTVYVKISYTNNGVTNYNVSFAMPGDVPLPAIWASQPNSTVITTGNGLIGPNADGSNALVTVSSVQKDGSGNITMSIFTDQAFGLNARYAWGQLSFLTS